MIDLDTELYDFMYTNKRHLDGIISMDVFRYIILFGSQNIIR